MKKFVFRFLFYHEHSHVRAHWHYETRSTTHSRTSLIVSGFTIIISGCGARSQLPCRQGNPETLPSPADARRRALPGGCPTYRVATPPLRPCRRRRRRRRHEAAAGPCRTTARLIWTLAGLGGFGTGSAQSENPGATSSYATSTDTQKKDTDFVAQRTEIMWQSIRLRLSRVPTCRNAHLSDKFSGPYALMPLNVPFGPELCESIRRQGLVFCFGSMSSFRFPANAVVEPRHPLVLRSSTVIWIRLRSSKFDTGLRDERLSIFCHLPVSTFDYIPQIIVVSPLPSPSVASLVLVLAWQRTMPTCRFMRTVYCDPPPGHDHSMH